MFSLGSVSRLNFMPFIVMQLRIEGTPMTFSWPRFTTNNHIAIDDVKFTSCAASLVSNASLNCDFESGDLCNWYQQPNSVDSGDWLISNNTSPSTQFGPNRDHTSGTGL